MSSSTHDLSHAADASRHNGLKAYLVGFVLAVLLTVIPFAAVMAGGVDRTAALLIVAVAAVIQVAVHLVFFLHMDTSPAQRSNTLTFIFTIVVVAILIGGSLWIMYNLNSNMLMGH